MRICVAGAGAIGGFLAAKLALAGHDVSVLARGAHCEAIRSGGLTLIDQHGGTQQTIGVRAAEADRLAELGEQELVILALKAHQIADLVPRLDVLLSATTPVVALQNGLPWWYFHRHGGRFDGRRLESVDPGGLIARHLPVERVIGCVAHKGAEISAPGVVRHVATAGDRFPVGEPDGSRSARVEAISAVLNGAWVAAPVITNIRTEKWFKLWGNLVWNPICALTHATVLDLSEAPIANELGVTMMLEAQAVAARLGVSIPGTPQARLARAREVGHVRPSMLQDTQAGRRLEIDALLGVIVELARLTGTAVPSIEAIYACAKLLDKVLAERRVRIVPQSLTA
ncbi:2-dehydropantoate 2-reductase [Piscinibacter sakaiensis]|uniref:2-dehydropantoate 2-reductase n=1 Tax=Piscinibacter sakaiensis TaxID=1547922 RepID=UPI003AAEE90F